MAFSFGASKGFSGGSENEPLKRGLDEQVYYFLSDIDKIEASRGQDYNIPSRLSHVQVIHDM